jgi:predicted O-linked N-acetylglucosamine transferase (SPINDLY family)
MGLPTLTWQGEAMWQRGAASTMKSLGLDEFVTTSEDAYVRQAAKLTTEAGQLRHLRGKLRALLADSAFSNPAEFAQDFVKALESVPTE